MAYSEKVRDIPPLCSTPNRPVQYVGFWLAYTLPTVVFLLCPIILIVGRQRYLRSPPTGSVLATFLRLFRFAAKGRWSLNPVRTYRNLTAPEFWEAAKPSRVRPSVRPSWMTFDDQWVNEVQRGLKACAVFAWFPIYCTFSSLRPSTFVR